jgi:hypothetical protein
MFVLPLLPSAAIVARGLDDFGWVLIVLASFAVWVYNQIKKANEEQAKKQAKPPQPETPPPRPRVGETSDPSRRHNPTFTAPGRRTRHAKPP